MWPLKKKAHSVQLTIGPEAKLLLFGRTLHLGAHVGFDHGRRP